MVDESPNYSIELQNIAQAIAAGRTHPSTPCKFSAYRVAAAVAGNSTFAQVIPDVELFDPGGNYSTTTGLFTAPVTGYYQFSWHIGTSVATTRIIASLAKNSTTNEIHRGSDVTIPSSVCASSGSALILLAAGDTAALLAFSASGATPLAVGTGNQCFFNGFLASI